MITKRLAAVAAAAIGNYCVDKRVQRFQVVYITYRIHNTCTPHSQENDEARGPFFFVVGGRGERHVIYENS